ncbi:hypothetical protein G9A89_000599, partial [Geosiphon pyriformis]
LSTNLHVAPFSDVAPDDGIEEDVSNKIAFRPYWNETTMNHSSKGWSIEQQFCVWSTSPDNWGHEMWHQHNGSNSADSSLGEN